MSEYRVFTKKGCGICKSVMTNLQKRGVPYEEIDVSTEEGLALAEKLNIMHAGTIIDRNENIVALKDVRVPQRACASCAM